MNTFNTIFRTLFTLVVLSLFSTLSTAQPSLADEEQPINISADSLESQEQKGVSVYKGNVIITQGSLKLKGNIITVYHPDSLLQSVRAKGQPAYFERYNQKEQAWLTGNANQIEYNAKYKTLLLIGDAEVAQPGKHVIKGPKLFYDLAKKTLIAKSSKTDKGRVSVTFSPAIADQKDQ
ncbi:MAG: lipopolysaccharide export system protein LptA [Thiomicrorhabdus sp.]|nr:MAG: lipopolysaccharide export system protein LptA [Thiomicrorhabdus sp.]